MNRNWTMMRVLLVFSVTLILALAYLHDVGGVSAEDSTEDTQIQENVTLHFEATIDGADILKVQSNRLWYEHKGWEVPHGYTLVNGSKWAPVWRAGGISDPYEFTPPLPLAEGKQCSVRKLAGRGAVIIREQPSDNNNYTLTIHIDDGVPPGADRYEIEIALEDASQTLTDLSLPSSETPTAAKQLEPIPEAEDLPGVLIFHGRYLHRSRGREYDQPGELWIKRQQNGAISALSHLPFFNETALAVGDADHRPIYYAASREPMGRYPAFEARLEFHEDMAIQTRHWGDERDDGKESPIETGALFDLNSRPDPYAVANLLVRRFALQSGDGKEFTLCDWGNSTYGKGTFPSYRVRVEHKGKETITVPAGTFETNHLVLNQITSADTWFKKRAGHVTDFWVMDNGVIVRIVRHREPYEIELVEWETPETLPGLVEVSADLQIVSARYGFGDKWVDVTDVLRNRVRGGTLVVRASNSLAGDPIYGVAKQLKVEYETGGKVYSTIVREGDILRIPDSMTAADWVP